MKAAHRLAGRGAAAVLLAVALCAPAAAAAAEAAADAASAPAQRSVGDIVARIGASERLQRDTLAVLPSPEQWRGYAQRTEAAEAVFSRTLPPAGRIEAPDGMAGLSSDLWALSNEVEAIVRDLGALVRRIERGGHALEQDGAQWQDDLAILARDDAPAAVIAAARETQAQAQAAAAEVRAARDQGLLALVRVHALKLRIHDAMSRLEARVDRMMARRAQLEAEPLWRLGAVAGEQAGLAQRLAASARLVRSYLAREGERLLAAAGTVFALCLWLFSRRAPAGTAQRGFERPVVSALLVALVAAMGFAANPPVVFYSLLLLAMPLPVMLIARRSFGASMAWSLAGLAAATMLMALRNLVDGGAMADRLLLLAQIGCVGIPVALDLHRGRLQQALARWSPESVRAVALVVLAAAALSALHAVFGMGGSLRTLRVGIAGVIGFGLIFGTAGILVYGALLSLLGTPLLSWLRSARHADPGLLRALRAAVALGAAAATAMATLGAMTLVPETLSTLDSVARSTIEIGAVTLTTSALAAALAIVLSTVALAGFVHFALDREVFPRLELRPGVGYAVATFARWLIFIVGGVLTLAALGVDATRITLLAGALGVGIGFGLQTVVNNFVSGLILIVERPVAVGDLVEIGPLLGEIQRIGIRSSSVRTTQGAEVIVPNSDLASKEVINWTRSDRQRRYDIDVGVAYGSDPKLVMRLLEEAAREVPEVMAHPAPMALFRGFGESSLDFRLLAWVSTIDLGLQAQNALRVAVLAKLGAAGIDIPFPQRDVRLVSVPAPGTS